MFNLKKKKILSANKECDAHLKNVEKTKWIIDRKDIVPILNDEKEIRLFVIARNESLRLPHFLTYYKNLGVDRFFLIDNNSSDDTQEIALTFDNVHVFQIKKSYKNHWDWMEFFLNKYGENHWCFVVDIDELFKFPHSESLPLRNLIKYLELNNYTAIRSILLDVYSEKPFNKISYVQGDDPLKYCNYFDPHFFTGVYNFFDKKKWVPFTSRVYSGGVRSRVFRKANENPRFFCLSKIPLFKYTKRTYLVQGMHAINSASIADIEGTVFHTKFLDDFNSRVKLEAKRKEHFENAIEYRLYDDFLKKDPYCSFVNEQSIKYEDNTSQLIKLRFMKISDSFNEFFEGFGFGR